MIIILIKEVVIMCRDCLREWEFHILEGDRSFHQQDYLSACLSFERATQALISCIRQPQTLVSECIRCFALACCNTAYSAIKAEKYHLAEHYYRFCLSQLETLMARPECHRLKQSLLLESELAYRRYCQFLAENNQGSGRERDKRRLLFDLGRWLGKYRLQSSGQQEEPNLSRVSLLFY
jgi:hypothetical protein